MNRPPISAIVTTLNEEDHIAGCLESLSFCDEIVLVDSHSSDRTVEIARSFEKVRVLERTYLGAASQKNWAMNRVSHDWILILDADERVTVELAREIESLLESGAEAEAYSIRRRTYILGRRIRFSGWQNDRVVRLFRRGAARYPNRRVHADMETKEPPRILAQVLDHFMVDDLAEYFRRIEKYSLWGAAQLYREGRQAGATQILGRSAWRFFRTWVLQGGVFDGLHGLVFCLLQAYGTFLKWGTLWGWRQVESQGRTVELPAFDDDRSTWEWSETSGEFSHGES